MDGDDIPRWDPERASPRSRLSLYFKFIRIEHTLFSLPFAYVGALLTGVPSLSDVILIGLAVLGLRMAGMAYNNIADIDIDKRNPRTMDRPLARGVISLREAWLIVAIGSIIYFISAALLNFYALLLSPLLWLIIMTYPHSKRWHSFPHLHLGLSLGMVVFGGSVAVSGKSVDSILPVLESVPYIYVIAVALWVSGFDVLYSIMDIEFDRAMGLGSIPAVYGVDRARILALAMHLTSISLLVLGCIVYKLGLIGLLTTLLASILMIYQHILAMKSLSNIPRAFNMNLVISLIISLGIIASKTFIL